MWLPQSQPPARVPTTPQAPRFAPVVASPVCDTIRPENLASPPHSPASRAVGSRTPARPHASTAPIVRPLGAQPTDDARGVVFAQAQRFGEADASRQARQRPVSAGGRMVGRRGGYPPPSPHDPHVLAAGKRNSERGVSREDSPGPPEARVAMEGVGWRPKTLEPEEHFRHDPILGKVEVFVRGSRGQVEPCHTAKGEFVEALRQANLAPRRPGRKKGIAEFSDLSAPCAAKWDPSHAAALKQDRHAFYRHQGEFSDMYNNAKSYPSSPSPFEPKGMRPVACRPAAFGVPPQPARPQVSSPRPGSSRVRRPQSAGRSSITPKMPVTKLSVH